MDLARASAWTRFVPGLLLCALLGAGALALAETPWVKRELHLGALLLVILAGMAVRTLVRLPASCAPGVQLAQRPILRWGVAFLGFRLVPREIAAIGLPSLVVLVVSTVVALAAGWWIGRALGLERKLGALLAVGSSICGASAIVAADSVLRAERRAVAASLGIVTLLGTVGIAVYPWLARVLGLDPFLFGVWAGASLHEMAQVVAAGEALGEVSLQTSTVVKLARICLLAPVVIGMAWLLRRRRAEAGEARVQAVPWFLVAFVAFAALNSTGWLHPAWVRALQTFGLWLLCAGMAGVGLQTGFRDLRDAGWRAILAGLLQWIALALVSLALASSLL